ncbi:MAG: HD domain-containing phosphohydrolase [Janthinobacterium lividum]
MNDIVDQELAVSIERLPIQPASAALRPGRPPNPLPVALSTEPLVSRGREGCDVLLLDDDEINNVLMEQAIRGIASCRSVAFNDPERALAAISAEPDRFSSVVTDYDMPGMNGIAFARSVRAIVGMQHVPIVMVTSFDQRRIRRDALEAGVTDFMGKPFDASEVKARLTNLLALDAARRSERDRSAWLAREVALATRTIREREREIVIRLARAAEYRDTDTGNHVARVAMLARSIALKLGCDRAWCGDLELASTMHDVGKIAVPDSILLKPGRLSSEEQAIVRRHADFGYGILEGSASEVIALAAEIALSHHERWDGQGYPHGLSGTAIPLSGRIVAVADVFDALVSDRPYKRAWSVEDAVAYIEAHAGSQFDPTCVGAFLEGKMWLGVEGSPKEVALDYEP